MTKVQAAETWIARELRLMALGLEPDSSKGAIIRYLLATYPDGIPEGLYQEEIAVMFHVSMETVRRAVGAVRAHIGAAPDA